MDDTDRLLTLFSADVELRDGTPVVEVPEREVDLGDVAAGETYRIAVLERPSVSTGTAGEQRPREQPRASGSTGPPVEEGEQCDVEIEDVGEQGDGIARVGPGYIVFVPGTSVGDRVTVEIVEARENFAFADVVGDEPIRG